MVPRTADGVAHHQAVGEGPAVVAARGTNREHLGGVAHEDHGLPVDVPEEGTSVLEAVEGNTCPEIRSLRF